MLQRQVTFQIPTGRGIAFTCLTLTILAACSSDPADPADSTDAANPTDPDASEYEGPSARGDARYSFALLQTEETFTVADFTEEYDEATCPSACDGNTAPTLGEPVFVVNGVVSDTLTASIHDDLAVFVPFADADCNLGCGMRSESHIEPQGGGDGAGSLPSNMPCSTEESDVYLRISPASQPLDAGHYTYTNWIEDGCGARSEVARIEFDLE